MITARNYQATADELAAAIVTERLEKYDDIEIRYNERLVAPYGVNTSDRLIVLPGGLTWRQAHSRVCRCWLYLTGGAALADEFAKIETQHPDRHCAGQGSHVPALASLPMLRRI